MTAKSKTLKSRTVRAKGGFVPRFGPVVYVVYQQEDKAGKYIPVFNHAWIQTCQTQVQKLKTTYPHDNFKILPKRWDNLLNNWR